MATHFKDIVIFVVGKTSSSSGVITYLDTTRGGPVAEGNQLPAIPWPTSSVQIIGTDKWVRPKRWELTRYVPNGNQMSADLSFKTTVQAVGYTEFNSSTHQMDIYLRNLFKTGGSLQLNITIGAELVPLIVALPKP